MRLGVLILTSFILTVNCLAQKSDLELSEHKFVYDGDSIELKSIVNFLQTEAIGLISEKEDICELEITKIGITDTRQYSIYFINWSFGISCRSGFATVFYQQGKYIGYFNSDLALPKEIQEDKLIWNFESGKSFAMDLSKEIPDSFLFDEFERKLIKN